MDNILKDILKNESQQDELEVFISSFFKSAAQEKGNPQKIVYNNCLTIEYSKKHKMKSITYNEKKQVINEFIRKAQDALLLNLGNSINRVFVFSPCRVNGFFKYNDKFQIIPLAPNAPSLDMMGDNPFIIEYKFKTSNDYPVLVDRAVKKGWEIALLLNVLLKHGVKRDNDEAVREWVLEVTGENSITSKYLQKGFTTPFDDRGTSETGFTSMADYQELKIVELAKYYETYGLSTDEADSLIIPDNIADSILAFEQLSFENKEKLLRSSYWTQIAVKTFHISKSGAFTSLITAIEVFLNVIDKRCKECGRPVSKDVCKKCRQPLAGPVKHFIDFVERYANNFELSTRKELYNIRSKITHGGYLFPNDPHHIAWQFNSHTISANENWHLLSQLVKTVQYNWLCDPA